MTTGQAFLRQCSRYVSYRLIRAVLGWVLKWKR